MGQHDYNSLVKANSSNKSAPGGYRMRPTSGMK